MKPTEPLPLHHSWPLFERARRLDLGTIVDWPETGAAASAGPALDSAALARLGVGQWECDLSDNSLTWSDPVYDIFGLPRGASVERRDVVELYTEESGLAMERLRAYAIKHKRGFTLDAQIRPASGPTRWMRLIAAPLCEGDRVVRLHGLKLAI